MISEAAWLHYYSIVQSSHKHVIHILAPQTRSLHRAWNLSYTPCSQQSYQLWECGSPSQNCITLQIYIINLHFIWKHKSPKFNLGTNCLIIGYWTTALWWTTGDIRAGNLAPTDLGYGLRHLPLMSSQHSERNRSGSMHSATALVW